MSIKIGAKIEKLAPGDTYKLMDLGDIEGAENIKSDISGLKAGQQTLEANINQKPDGLHLEDEDGNVFSDVTHLAISGASLSDSGGIEVNMDISPKITVANGQTLGSTSATGNALIFEGSNISEDIHDNNVIHIKTNSPLKLSDGVGVASDITELHLQGADIRSSDGIANIHVPFKHFKTIAERDAWEVKFKTIVKHDVVAVVDADDNGFTQFYIYRAAKHIWEEYDAQGVVMSDSNGAIPKNIKTVVFGPGFSIQQAGDQEDAALVTYSGGSGSGGMTINGKHIDDLTVMAPLQIDNSQSQDRLLVDPRAYENQHAASCLLELDSDVTLQNGKATRLYTSHEIVPTGEYFSLNKQARGVDVQDNTGGDTAATGGELTRIMASVGFYGKATDAGNVKVWVWYKDPASPLAGGVLKDVNGNPMVAERFYNKGDDLETPLVISGAMMATGNAPIVLYVETSAGSYVVDPKQTLLCVEQFSDGFETSLASIEFQRRLGIAIDAEIKSFTQEMLSLKEELIGLDMPLDVVSAHEGYDFLNEFGIQNLTEVKASVTSGVLNIQDNGNVADFYVDVFLDNTKTRMLRGKDIDVELTLKNIRDSYRLEAYKWTGKSDAAGRVYDSRNNEIPTLNPGFELIKSKFITEQVDGQYHGYVDTFTVPEDANNIFIIVRPVEAQSPIDMSIKDFTWGVATPFKGYAEISRTNLNEVHFKFDKNYAEFFLNNQGFSSLRYTINNTPDGNPMPVGKLAKGKGPVVIDNTVNQVPSSVDPQNDGAIKFTKDGEAIISKSYNVWNEQSTDNTVTFWDILIDVDGNETKIPESEKTFTIPANTGAPGVVYSIPAYNVMVETGQRIGGRAKSNKTDGAYIQSVNPSEYIVQTIVEFDELKVNP